MIGTLTFQFHSGSVSPSPMGNTVITPAAATLALYASGSNQRIGACWIQKYC